MTQVNETTTATRTVAGAEVPATGTWVIDAQHSAVQFVARHLMVTKVRGGFKEFSGSFVVAEDPTESSVEVTMQAASFDSGAADRDAHVRSGDFLDVEKYPTVTFKSTRVEQAGSAWKLYGDLTIRDTTRPVVLDFEFEGAATDPWGNTKAAFTGHTEIDREEWGLTWNVALEGGGVLVSKKVKIEFEVQAGLQQ
jgi:polyisoprenoid-binding protein YceI